MSAWPSAKAKKVYAALLRIGWRLKREAGGSHRVLERSDWPDFVFAFHDREEIGPRMLVAYHLRAVAALEKANFRVVRQGKHIVMSDGTRSLPFRGTTQ